MRFKRISWGDNKLIIYFKVGMKKARYEKQPVNKPVIDSELAAKFAKQEERERSNSIDSLVSRTRNTPTNGFTKQLSLDNIAKVGPATAPKPKARARLNPNTNNEVEEKPSELQILLKSRLAKEQPLDAENA